MELPKKDITSDKKPSTSDMKSDNKKSYAAKTIDSKLRNKSVVPNNSEESLPAKITTQHVAAALSENETHTKCNKYINLTQKVDPINKNERWNEVVNRRRKRQLIVGSNNKIEVDGVAVKGVPKTVTLHVYRVEPSMKADSLRDLLTPYFLKLLAKQSLRKHPQLYSSFKVNIYENNFDVAMDPEKWPTGAYVQRFFNCGKGRTWRLREYQYHNS
ncbi:hypothetical protein NQ317_017936 [Molorchus minor]|uniref:Uncharacterized protein n=1 Tax=Molorchus minor TaxID=1323400 RepID=A0ABQ9JRE9_9CUCU|nr:hypothetical protein NQ317_017936 [Molorchus minor]